MLGPRRLLSVMVALLCLCAVPLLASTTERVSVSSGGEQGNAHSSGVAAVSADGRYVCFSSLADNLVPGDTNDLYDAFVHDRLTGHTERVSVSSTGEEANGDCTARAISANGRYVVFDSWADNLVADDTLGAYDVFVHDRLTGETTRVSVPTGGGQANGNNEFSDISADGRFVAFRSNATNLVDGDTNACEDIFVHDRLTGETVRVSVDSDGNQADGDSVTVPSISGDGRRVAFASFATNLVSSDTNGSGDVFVHDLVTGDTVRVSVSSDGEEGNDDSWEPRFSRDGRYVAFGSEADNLVGLDANVSPDTFVHDLTTGATEVVSLRTVGGSQFPAGGSAWLDINADGRFVAFTSSSIFLVDDDTNEADDVFLYDRFTGETTRVSVDTEGNQGDGYSVQPRLSADGRYVAFVSIASNLVLGDTNASADVFVHDRDIGMPPLTSLTSFEEGRYPWSAFSAGPGAAQTSRTFLTGIPSAHSGAYVMSTAIEDQAITGLRLALPTEPSGPTQVTLRAWAYLGERTEGDSSTFFGFLFDEDYPTSAAGWSQALGWEVLSDTTSQFQLVGDTDPVGVGLAEGGWHLVTLTYSPSTETIALWVDAEEVAETDCPNTAGQAATYAFLGVLGESNGARQHVYFDDLRVTLTGYAGPPEADHPFAILEGPEQVTQGETYTYTIIYGNGYPMLNLEEVTETLAQTLYLGLSLPADYIFVSSDPAVTRLDDGTPVWELDLPARGQMGYMTVELTAPSGLAEVMVDRIWAWGTLNGGASATYPPSPPTWTDPTDGVWDAPQDVIPQRVELQPGYDVWVRKRGPRTASPGDTIVYSITVGNAGYASATDITVRDTFPGLLGGADTIIANLPGLAPGDTWTGIATGALPWGVPGGTLLLNTAYIPTGPAEASPANNSSQYQTTVQVAMDPNAISVSPTGGVNRGQTLTYSLECENVGLGTAYGVYATCVLDRKLDAGSLLTNDPADVSYDPVSRILVWEVGTLASEEGADTSFTINVTSNAPRGRPIIEQAVVYFPSVPEETPTNIVYNVVTSTFSDVPWDFWAILQIEQTYENGIVRGYDDGTYRPSETVTRDQMAVYMAKALDLPTGPYEGRFADDVPITQWAWPWIEALAREDLVQGYDATHYGPSAAVTRDQMAVYVARALAGGMAIPTGPAVGKFVDVPDADPGPAHWAYDEVEYCVARGVVAGYDPTHYLPAGQVDRGQMAVYVTRAFRLPM